MRQLAATPSETFTAGANNLPDALFIAARQATDELNEPQLALTLYRRLATEFPHNRLAVAAERRAAELSTLVGTSPAHANAAAAFARTQAQSNTLPPHAVTQAITALASSDWPGAAEALLWLGEYQRRVNLPREAAATLVQVERRFPAAPAAAIALRTRASLAIEQRQWQTALEAALRLPVGSDAETAVRAELLRRARVGLRLHAWYRVALAAAPLLAIALLALVWGASHLYGTRRIGAASEAPIATAASPTATQREHPSGNDVAVGRAQAGRPAGLRTLWPPPVEVYLLTCLGVLFVAIAATGNEAIAPAIAIVFTAAIFGTWCTSAIVRTVLAQLAGKGAARPGLRRAQTLFISSGVVAALLLVSAALYIALVRRELLLDLIETLRFGPEL